MATAPSLAGTVTSQTPKLSLVMGFAVGSQLSARVSSGTLEINNAVPTKIADQRSLLRIGCPFPVFDLAARLRVKTECFVTLGAINFFLPVGVSGSIHLAELVQSSLVLIDILSPFLDDLVPVLQDVAMRLQPRV